MTIHETSTYYVYGTSRAGSRFYFTGKEGKAWLTHDRHECFTQFSQEQAKAWARTFNALTEHHGLTFYVERAR